VPTIIALLVAVALVGKSLLARRRVMAIQDVINEPSAHVCRRT
jgi:hypothetical protein